MLKKDLKEVIVKLLIFGIDLNNGQYHIASLNERSIILPSVFLKSIHKTNNDMDKALKLIISKYLDINIDWLSIDLIKIYLESTKITVTYRTIIPLDTKLQNAYWLQVSPSLTDSKILDAMQDI